MNKFKFIVTDNFDKLKYFLLELGFSYNLIKSLSKEIGQVCKNGKPIRMNEKISNNDIIEVNFKESEKNCIVPTKEQLNIVYEDDYYIIVYKNNGVATIPSYCNFTNSIANFVTSYMFSKGETDFIFRAFNRLDKETSGYVLICKDLVSYDLLLKNKDKVAKKYEVITNNKITENRIDFPILTTKDEYDRNSIKRLVDSKGKPAITNILCTQYSNRHNISYATIALETGRTHQIRVHLSTINAPILGDALYNKNSTNNAELMKNLNLKNRMYLNCYSLSFYHPIKQKMIHIEQQAFKSIFNKF